MKLLIDYDARRNMNHDVESKGASKDKRKSLPKLDVTGLHRKKQGHNTEDHGAPKISVNRVKNITA